MNASFSMEAPRIQLEQRVCYPVFYTSRHLLAMLGAGGFRPFHRCAVTLSWIIRFNLYKLRCGYPRRGVQLLIRGPEELCFFRSRLDTLYLYCCPPAAPLNKLLFKPPDQRLEWTVSLISPKIKWPSMGPQGVLHFLPRFFCSGGSNPFYFWIRGFLRCRGFPTGAPPCPGGELVDTHA